MLFIQNSPRQCKQIDAVNTFMEKVRINSPTLHADINFNGCEVGIVPKIFLPKLQKVYFCSLKIYS